jgi:hypothetical protein
MLGEHFKILAVRSAALPLHKPLKQMLYAAAERQEF